MSECIDDTVIEDDKSIKINVNQKKKSQTLLKSKRQYVDNVETYLRDENASFTENEDESDADDPDDKDWIQTPLYRRIKQVREQNKTTSKGLSSLYNRDLKRKSSHEEDSDDATIVRASKIK